MQGHLILCSSKPEDADFALEVSRGLNLPLSPAATKERLWELFHSQTGCTILLDVDAFVDRGEDFPRFQDMAMQIEKLKAWHRVIGISSYALNDVVVQGKFPAYSKYLLRNYTPESTEAYSYVIRNMISPNPFDELPSGVSELQIQRARINNSGKKKSALEALTTILEKKTLPARVSKAVVRATDELILNAIFDAPIDLAGRRYKHELDRSSEYALNQLSRREEVEVELISTKNFLQVSVTDFFGSLQKDEYLALLEQQLSPTAADTTAAQEYAPGLGLYLTLSTGLSIQVLVEPNKRTRVTLMVPWVENVRELKYAFRFFCLRQK